MKTKLLLSLLTFPILLTACGPVEEPEVATFDVFEITDCRSYFDYLAQDIEDSSERSDGLVVDITCDGTVDYQEGELFDLGLLFDYEDESKRISLKADDELDPEELLELHGENVSITGDLEIQVLGDSGVILHAEDYVVE